MDAKTAFDQFEKRGAGLLPVIVLSALAFAATVVVVQFAAQLTAIEADEFGFLRLGAAVGELLSAGEHLRLVSDEASQVDKLKMQQQHAEISRVMPAGYTHCGAFASDAAGRHLHETWFSEQGSMHIEIMPLTVAGDAERYTIAITSLTEEDETIVTATNSNPLPAPPWQDWQAVEDNVGTISEILPKLIATHVDRIRGKSLTPTNCENYIELSYTMTRRYLSWLVSQAPLPSNTLAELLKTDRRDISREEAAQLLLGFCAAVSEHLDAWAIEAFRKQRTDNSLVAENDERTIVLHALTNRLHLASKLKATLKIAMVEQWTQELLGDSATDPQGVEKYFNELTSRMEVRELGEIQQPFPAKIYRLGEAEHPSLAPVNPQEIKP